MTISSNISIEFDAFIPEALPGTTAAGLAGVNSNGKFFIVMSDGKQRTISKIGDQELNANQLTQQQKILCIVKLRGAVPTLRKAFEGQDGSKEILSRCIVNLKIVNEKLTAEVKHDGMVETRQLQATNSSTIHGELTYLFKEVLINSSSSTKKTQAAAPLLTGGAPAPAIEQQTKSQVATALAAGPAAAPPRRKPTEQQWKNLADFEKRCDNNVSDLQWDPMIIGAEKHREFTSHVTAFLNLLNTPKLPEQQEIFFSVGFGTRTDQKWPACLLEIIQKNNGSALNILVENDRMGGSGTTLGHEIRQLADNAIDILDHLPKLSVNQFACGLPGDEVGSPLNWDSQEQLVKFQNSFVDFVERCVKAGKTVNLGYYCDYGVPAYVLNCYNDMKVKYPDRIFLLSGHEEFAGIPKGQITAAQLVEAQTFSSKMHGELGKYDTGIMEKKFGHLFHFFISFAQATLAARR